MGLAPGTVFAGRYEILAPLGQGAMGSVYRARHVDLGSEVALKLLGGSMEDGAARFEREARAIAKLDHPGCVRILDYGRTRKNQFIAMQLLDGKTLGQVMATEALSISRALAFARGLAAALVHAHGRGVLHRDLKPENVMIVGARPVLIDFGLAHVLDDAPLTGRGLCVGSPSYLAPERLDGAPHDARADLYSLGVIIYEMLTGVRPFTGECVGEILFASRTKPARPVRAIRPDVSAQLEAVIVRALTKDPSRRFQTAEDMLAALDDVPVLEQLAVIATSAAREEVATTMVEARPVHERRPHWFARTWARLRFGRWRWRSPSSSSSW